jgi:hypothetical protein
MSRDPNAKDSKIPANQSAKFVGQRESVYGISANSVARATRAHTAIRALSGLQIAMNPSKHRGAVIGRRIAPERNSPATASPATSAFSHARN